MLGSIIIKEFFDNLLNLRFTVGLLVSVLLTVASVMFQARAYSERTQDYHADVRLQEETIEKYGPIGPFHNERVLLKPAALSLVATGLTADSYDSFDANFLPQIFPFIDLVFIVSIIMSLLGLLFSYDSICGEKESGTLKLICSNSLSRATVLFGKLLGGTASLLVPFLISVLCAAIYIALDPGVMWQAVDWTAFGALTAASMLYISLFYLMGMMVSAFSKSSSVSILKAVLLWVVIVLVIPNLGPYISTELYPLETLKKVEREYNRYLKGMQKGGEFKKQIEDQYAELDRKYEQEYGELFREYIAIPRADRLKTTGMEAPDSDIKSMGLKYRQEYRAIYRKVMEPLYENFNKFSAQLKIEGERQTEAAKNIAAISPFTDYIYLSADLAGTGMRSRENIKRATLEFYTLVGQFSKEKSAEKDRKRISDWKNIKNDPLDISGRPRFSYEEEPLPGRVSDSLPYLAVMLLYGVLFFAIAFVGFIRYDVR